jgi:hypothetical protein
VIGYGKTPIANTNGISVLKIENERSIKREVPRIFNMVREPRKKLARIK